MLHLENNHSHLSLQNRVTPPLSPFPARSLSLFYVVFHYLWRHHTFIFSTANTYTSLNVLRLLKKIKLLSAGNILWMSLN